MIYKIKKLFILLLLPSLGLAQEVFYDPMRPLIKMPIVTQPIVTQGKKVLKINMIFYVEPSSQKNVKSWAIINGRKYFIGDIALGRKLVDISSGEVLFEHKGKQYKQGLVTSSYVKTPMINKNNYDSFDGR